MLRIVPRSSIAIGLLVIGAIAGTIGLSQYLQDQMARHLIDSLLASQKQRVDDKVLRFDATLRNAEASVRRYAALMSDERPGLQPAASAFALTFQRDADGSWRVPRHRFDAQRDANAWIPPDVPLSEENKRFYLKALQVTGQFGQGALHEPMVNSWLLPLSNGMTAYWPSKPDYLYDAGSKLDYRQTPWVTRTDPRVNPGHEPRWVGPEYDPAARDWSISVVAPFFHNGRWAGSLGHDMVVSKLVGSLLDQEGQGSNSLSRPLFVATTRGRLLAKPDGVPAPGEMAPPQYLPLLRKQEGSTRLRVVPEGPNYLLVASIPTLNAKLVYQVDGGWLRRSVGKELFTLQMGQGLFVLLVVGSLIGVGVKDAQGRREQQRLLEQRNADLMTLAREDQLTNLPNRLGLIDRAEASLSRARRTGNKLLVMFLDLDRFKVINDSLGHSSGDALLQSVSARLRSQLRETDTVARLGGDEFVLIIENFEDLQDAGQKAQSLHQAFSAPMDVQGTPMRVTPSIGVSVFPDDGQDIETLMRQADMAMYEVKSRGRDGWLFFDEEMNRSIQQRLQLERDIRLAIERDEFHLSFQPQWEIDGQRLIGWEALLRWNSEERGSVPPDLFIPVAEEIGVIDQLGQMVLQRACQEAARWREQGFGDFIISVNLSARQFTIGNLVEQIEKTLHSTGLDPNLLELEITESVMMENPHHTQEVLSLLKRKGIRVAIDDFGTGYSSLSYLSSFPIDRLKIDRSFVAASLSDPQGAVIVETVISLARSLGMIAIAEGVETQEQRTFLKQKGCHQIQGYLTGSPMPAAAIEGYLKSHPH
ncbi:MAG: EAL domain-containing protein [Synechococcus sp. ELA057]